ESYRWKPSAEKWNLLDVVSHFVDEEVEDFRARVGSILNDPSKPLQPFNPEAWVMERKYSENNFESKIAEFVAERAKSVAWLRGLNNPKWDNAFQHPKVGPVTAQLILENWLAHDILHIRQILGLKYGYLKVNAKSPLDYAGNW
ncbi:MAG: DinB family protein, partial [Flavobacteriales bacterium]